MMEEALRLFNEYDNQTYTCLKNCKEAGQSVVMHPGPVIDLYKPTDMVRSCRDAPLATIR